MEWEAALKIVTASVASVGVSGVIIFSLSSWLGKVWANRILEVERQKFEEELEKTKRELDVIKETTLRFQNDKILAYRAVIDVVSRILSSFDAHQLGRLPIEEAAQRFDEFNEQRMRVYGYLAILAPQTVMDAQDELMDYLLEISGGSESYDWKKVRDLAVAMINEVRVDIGIDKTPLSYKGKL